MAHQHYEPWRYPTPFTRTCANHMAHRLRQTSIIFRHLKFPRAHRWSKWPKSEAGNFNISIEYTMHVTNTCLPKIDKHITVRTVIFRLAHQISWYFHHTNLDVIDKYRQYIRPSSRPSSRKLQTIGKSFQNHLGLGLDWLHLTRSERGVNGVRTRSKIKILETDPPKSPDKPSGSHMLSHYQTVKVLGCPK